MVDTNWAILSEILCPRNPNFSSISFKKILEKKIIFLKNFKAAKKLMEILRQRRLPDAKKNHLLFRRNFHEFLRNLNNKIYAVLLNDQTQMCPLFTIFLLNIYQLQGFSSS